MSKPDTTPLRKPRVTVTRSTPREQLPLIPGGVRRAPHDCGLSGEQWGVLCAVASIQEYRPIGAMLVELEPATGLSPPQIVMTLTSMNNSLAEGSDNPFTVLVEKVSLPTGGSGARLTPAGWDLLRRTTN